MDSAGVETPSKGFEECTQVALLQYRQCPGQVVSDQKAINFEWLLAPIIMTGHTSCPPKSAGGLIHTPNQAMAKFNVGDIQIQRIVEMVVPYDTIDRFFPRTPVEDIESCRDWLEPQALCPDSRRLIITVQSYLVRTPFHTVLIDTCVGCNKTIGWFEPFNQRTDERWLERLSVAGVTPEDVDFVFCTHLHGDHVGWNTRLRDGRWVPTFPNARYIMSDTDASRASSGGGQCYRENILPVVEAGQALLVDSDYQLDDHLWLESTPGHTLGHVAVAMGMGGHQAVMCGDLIHSPVQCAFPHWQPVVDEDPVQAVSTRKSFLRDNCDSGRLVMTAHFPEPSIGRVAERGDAFEFIYAEEV